MSDDLWIIEARNPNGSLDLRCAQPERIFSNRCITGMTADRIGDVVLRYVPGAILSGQDIPHWPSILHTAWVARRKTW